MKWLAYNAVLMAICCGWAGNASATGFAARCQGAEGKWQHCRIEFTTRGMELHANAITPPTIIAAAAITQLTMHATAVPTSQPSVVAVPGVTLPSTSSTTASSGTSSTSTTNTGTAYVPITSAAANAPTQFELIYTDAAQQRHGVVIAVDSANAAGLRVQFETLTGHPLSHDSAH